MARVSETWSELSTIGKVTVCLVPVLLMLILYARVYWYETETYTEDVGLNGEAATNPFFGFETLAKANLAPRGGRFINLEESVNVADHPPEKSLLMLSAWRLSRMTPERVKAIAAWVERGGNLVLEAEPLGQEDPLLKAFGIDRWRVVWRKSRYVELPPKKISSAKDDKSSGSDADDDTEVMPEFLAKQVAKAMAQGTGALKIEWDDGETYRVKLNRSMSFRPLKEREDDFTVAGDAGNAIIKRKFGKGHVVAMASFAFMRRAAILKDDAGVFAMRLLEPYARPPAKAADSAPVDPQPDAALEGLKPAQTDDPIASPTAVAAVAVPIVDAQLPPNPTNVVLGLYIQPKSLLQWLVKHGFAVLLAAMALLLLWLWHIIPRFGPIAAPQTEARRNIADHWRAAGQYLLGRRQWLGLLHAPRTRVTRRLRQRMGIVLPTPTALTAEAYIASEASQAYNPEQLARVEQVCKVSAGRIHSALHAVPATPSQLLAFIITLRQMEAALK